MLKRKGELQKKRILSRIVEQMVQNPKRIWLISYEATTTTNNNNNYTTSIAPMSLKIIELSGGPSLEVGQTRSPYFRYNAKFINN